LNFVVAMSSITKNAQNSSNIFIGCSGWSYPEWNGIVYPKDFPQAQMFMFYQSIFHTVEINSSFYQLPSEKTALSWLKASEPNFLFSAKVPKLVTHEGKLDLTDVGKVVQPLKLFINNMLPLVKRNQMLAFLLQLPPSFRYQFDYTKLESFLTHWNEEITPILDITEDSPSSRKVKPQLVVEFRDASWMRDETFSLLKQQKTSYCAVVEPLLPPRLDITNDSLFYLRFHGFGKNPWFNYCFSDTELDDWSQKLAPIIDEHRNMADDGVQKNQPKRAVLYFNNHFSGNAVKNALYLANILQIPVKKTLNDVNGTTKSSGSVGLSSKQKKIDEFYQSK
jgi:uncharacterized protein YecE (DUF72 family)